MHFEAVKRVCGSGIGGGETGRGDVDSAGALTADYPSSLVTGAGSGKGASSPSGDSVLPPTISEQDAEIYFVEINRSGSKRKRLKGMCDDGSLEGVAHGGTFSNNIRFGLFRVP